ncbi:proton extrusion protein PcxA [Sesbania bispinosa]|nr:proton extrusion protein PcxA [Sesbania bispinosa]
MTNSQQRDTPCFLCQHVDTVDTTSSRKDTSEIKTGRNTSNGGPVIPATKKSDSPHFT